MKELLNISHISVGYKSHLLIDDFNTSACSGEFIAVVGLNGSGKSTLLNTLSGQLLPLSGTVKSDGTSIHHLTARQRARCMSVVSTKSGLPTSLEVLTVVTLGRYALQGTISFSTVEDERKSLKCLSILKLEHLAEKRMHEISDGEYQKVMIARALSQESPIMILDEPTAFLDYRAKAQIMDELSRLTQERGLCIIFSSHDLDLVKKYATKIWYVSNNHIEVGLPQLLSSLINT